VRRALKASAFRTQGGLAKAIKERWPGQRCSQAGIAQTLGEAQKTSIFVEPISEILGLTLPTVDIDSELQYRAFELLSKLPDAELAAYVALLEAQAKKR